MTRSRRICHKTLLVLGGTVFGLLLCEIALRVLRPPVLAQAHQPLIYDRDAVLGYRYRANATGHIRRHFEIDNEVVINSRGFHDVDHDLSADGYRVVVVGDSFTAALHVPIPKTWTQVLESRLKASRDPSAQVINLGRDGTGTNTHLEILKANLPGLHPDVVIVAFYENDFAECRLYRVYRESYRGYILAYQSEAQARDVKAMVDNTLRRTFLWWLHRNLYSARLVIHRLKVPLFRSNFVPPTQPKDKPMLRSELDAAAQLQILFESFLRLSKERNFRLVVVPVPDRERIQESLEVLRTHLKLDRFEVVDVSTAVRELLRQDGRSLTDMYWRHDGHFNEYGNKVFGQAIAKTVFGLDR